MALRGTGKVRWFLRRASLMSVPEVLYRGRLETRKGLERVLIRTPRAVRRVHQYSGDEIAPVRWLIDLGAQGAIRDRLLRGFGWTPDLAQRTLEHRLSFFRLDQHDFGSQIRWNYDGSTETPTPMQYGPSLDYRDPSTCGDIKYVWELNRHQHLVELAKAFFLLGDEKYALEVVRQIDSWITSCPYPYGVNWASSLESAIRIINWTVCIQFLIHGDRRWKEKHTAFFRRWLASIHEHLKFIAANLSLYSSGNNHLIGEASGLFVGALCYRFDESVQWMEKSRKILALEAAKQTWADGVNKEQATHYHAFVLDLLLLTGLLGRRNDVSFGKSYWTVLEKMAEYVAALCDDRGFVPAIGDQDDGYVVLWSHDQREKQMTSLLATAASVFDREDFRQIAKSFDEKSYWLLGGEGEEAFNRAHRRGPERLSFKEGGCYIVKDEDTRLIFDAGPLGYLSLAAHGHADMLSIVLDHRGKHFFVDPGTYAYHARPEWRSYFRGTAAHNTLRLNGEDQSVMGGNFMWLERGNCSLTFQSQNRLVGRHDGYTRFAEPAVHERELLLDRIKHRLVITDRVLTSGTQFVELFWHCAPECRCTLEDGRILIVNEEVSIVLVPDPRMKEVNIFTGSTDPIAGWYSPGYDRKVPTSTIRLACPAIGDSEFVTQILFPYDSGVLP